MKYYVERNGLLEDNLSISLEELKEYFNKVYRAFYDRNCFEAAINGVCMKSRSGGKHQIIPPLFEPEAEIFFMNHLRRKQVYPIWEYYEYYSKEELFTVIEILYDKIALYDYEKNVLEQDRVKEEFATNINNILQFYDGGYYLEPNNGFICKGVNESLKEMLKENLNEILNDNEMIQMRSAVKSYYKFDSNLESKKKAITTMADILESVRSDLKNILNEKFDVNKNDHDKLIFEIVNAFNIRHNNAKQKTNYEHEIWYDWMMQYYSSVIIAYFKLKAIKL